MDLRRKLFSHILNIRPSALAKESTGDLMSAITMDIPLISRKAATFMPIIVGNVFALVFATYVLFLLSPHLLLISFLFIPLYYLAWKKEYGPMLESGRKEREKTGTINERTREGVENVMVIKLYRAKNFFLGHFNRVQNEWFTHIKHLIIHLGLLRGAILGTDWIAPYIILGAGIYVLLGEIALLSGTLTPIAFLVAAIVVSFSAYSYRHLVRRFPFSAGEAIYVQEAFGSIGLSRLVGIALVFSGIVSSATLARGFTGYFSILMSLANAGELGGGATSGTLISLLGFGRVFLYSAWIFGPALIILYFIKFKKQTRKA